MEKILKDKNYMEISGDEMPSIEPVKKSTHITKIIKIVIP